MSDDRFLTRGAFVVIGLLLVLFSVAWIAMAGTGNVDRWPDEATLIVIGLVNLLVGLLGGRAISR